MAVRFDITEREAQMRLEAELESFINHSEIAQDDPRSVRLMAAQKRLFDRLVADREPPRTILVKH